MFHKLEHFLDFQDFLAIVSHADSAHKGPCIPQREEALSLRHAGQSPHSSDHEEARATGRLSPVNSARSPEYQKERDPCHCDIR